MSRKLPIGQVDYIIALYCELHGLGLSPHEMIRTLGLLMHKICTHEGRALTAGFLADIFDKCQAAQIEHEINKELDDGLLISHLHQLAEEKRVLNG